jgi:membrane protease YdiL (CAAX protease family)
MPKQPSPYPIRTYGWLRVLIFLALYLLMMAGISHLSLEIYTKFTFLLMSGAALVWLFRKFVDGSDFLSLGLSWKGSRGYALTGFLAAIALLGTGTCILAAAGVLEWINYQFDANAFFMSLVLMLMVAFTEELVFRGYVINNLLQNMKPHIALLVSAALFAIFHGANPGTSWLALINIFIAGILLGINYVFTGNLWFGIALHFAWNFFQGPVLGFAVSGLKLPSVLIQNISGNTMVTGGEFGFEGSLIYSILAVILIVVFYFRYKVAKN